MSDLDTSAVQTTRRGFLGSGSALVVAFALPVAAGRVQAATGDAFKPNAWLRITPDGNVTVVCGSAEMGQGVHTAIPMMVAEELDADWTKVRVEQAPVDQSYNNPAFQMQATGGSTTVRGHWQVVRTAGAAAREMLVAAAATRWNTTPEQCRTERGQVVHSSGKKLAYGALVADAAKLTPPAKPALKDPKNFKIIGKHAKRLDTPGKVNGTAKYGIDVSLPGMLVAVMARQPMPNTKPRSVDDSAAKAVPGVKQVITIPHGVAVLATGYWAAKQGRDALKIDWDMGASADLSDAKVSELLDDGARKGGAMSKDLGNLRDAASTAAASVDARYEAPYIAHACMEPMNCTAWVKGDEVEIWAGTQSQGPSQGILSQVAAVSPAKVKVNTMMLGGGFGRRFAPDFSIDATLLSKISGAPVKLIYTREDDMRAGFYRPPSVARFEGAVDAQGRISMFKAGVGTPSIMVASGFMKLPDSGVDSFAMEGIDDHPYDIPAQRIEYARVEPAGPQIWFWRSVGHSQNSFFMESFVDELAHAAKKDPYEFRRAMLGKSPRHKAVLELAAAKAGWGQPLPAGVHRGIAVVSSFGSYVAEVAEVSVAADGTPRVHRVVAAIDCGMTVNPTIIARQVEGAIVYGLGQLQGRISIAGGKVTTGNFHDYPVLRMSEMPKVEVHIVPSTEGPGGVGEPGTPPVAPAVANAIFAATGKRLRSMPFDTAQLKRA